MDAWIVRRNTELRDSGGIKQLIRLPLHVVRIIGKHVNATHTLSTLP